jgi:TPR repeat protein
LDGGDYVKKNKIESLLWLEKAAEGKHPNALWKLGIMNLHGAMYEKNLDRGVS